MVSTGWRTAATVIIIIIGAAMLTFGVFLWRRQRMLRRAAQHPEMQQRFMSSYAGDLEAHTPLLYSDITPPLPPKTLPSSHQRAPSGAVDELGFKLRVPPARVPVPPMPVRSPAPDTREVCVSRSDPEAAMPMPEPSALHKLFPSAALLQFPRVQFSRTNTRVGRLPSLHIQFLRESEQVVSSPMHGLPDPDKRISLPESTVSAPSTLSRPFATMAKSPLPPLEPLEPISPISITRSSPTSVSKTDRSDSVGSIGHNLFTRKASAEDMSCAAFSRNPSQQSRLSPGTIVRGNGSASSASSGSSQALLRRATTWTPNVLASYSPWKGVVQENGWAVDGQQSGEAGPSRVESPGGQIRVADAYRPMPTLTETAENVAAATMPRPLPAEPPSTAHSNPGT
ncbi:hypothetical protein BV20DRAFT_59823 [Pilatotrama ljubarskyi]|nr:hypothetical protein BV20DRAFT_59823 [Pilatotrama ljubarskyi]